MSRNETLKLRLKYLENKEVLDYWLSIVDKIEAMEKTTHNSFESVEEYVKFFNNNLKTLHEAQTFLHHNADLIKDVFGEGYYKTSKLASHGLEQETLDFLEYYEGKV